MTRSQAWAMFAANSSAANATTAAAQADAMLAEYDRRFLDSRDFQDEMSRLVSEPGDDPIAQIQKIRDACRAVKGA